MLTKDDVKKALFNITDSPSNLKNYEKHCTASNVWSQVNERYENSTIIVNIELLLFVTSIDGRNVNSPLNTNNVISIIILPHCYFL